MNKSELQNPTVQAPGRAERDTRYPEKSTDKGEISKKKESFEEKMRRIGRIGLHIGSDDPEHEAVFDEFLQALASDEGLQAITKSCKYNNLGDQDHE